MKLSLRKFVRPADKVVMWFLERDDRPATHLLLDTCEPQLLVLCYLGLIDRKDGEWVLEERTVPVAELVDAPVSEAGEETLRGSSPLSDTEVVRRCCP